MTEGGRGGRGRGGEKNRSRLSSIAIHPLALALGEEAPLEFQGLSVLPNYVLEHRRALSPRHPALVPERLGLDEAELEADEMEFVGGGRRKEVARGESPFFPDPGPSASRLGGTRRSTPSSREAPGGGEHGHGGAPASQVHPGPADTFPILLSRSSTTSTAISEMALEHPTPSFLPPSALEQKEKASPPPSCRLCTVRCT